MITETNVPHAENISYFGSGDDEAQMVYNFTLPPLLLYTMLTQNTRQLRQWINTLSTPSNQTTFFNFTASHDGIGVRPLEGILDQVALQMITSVVEERGGLVSYRNNPDGSRSPYELNITYIDAVIDPSLPPDLQRKQFILSQSVAMSLAGVPAIYIHSLLGSHNNLDGVEKLGYNRAINRAKLNLPDILAELDDPTSFRAQVFNHLATLLKLRAEQPAFHPNAAQSTLNLENDHILAIFREAPDGGQRLLALHNFTSDSQTVLLNLDVFQAPIDLITGESLNQIHLPPFAVRWITESS
jgi:sucrose phosphorylase